MDLVIDANILIAALIKQRTTYTLLFNNKLHLYSAEYLFSEIEEHKKEILKIMPSGRLTNLTDPLC